MISSGVTILKQNTNLNHLVLSATVAKKISIVGVRGCVFSSDVDFYAKTGGSSVAAAIPAADVTDGSGSMFNPEARVFNGDDEYLSVISKTDGVVTLEFF